MGIGRIASSYLTSQANFLFGMNQSKMARIQEQIAQGRNIVRPSDDPLGMTRILNITNLIDNDNRYLRNIDSGLAELRATDTAMASLTDLGQRAMELATQGATLTVSDANADAIALEVNQLIDQAILIGNTKNGERYIFGGLATNAPPFNRTGDTVAYTGTAATGNFQRNLEVSPNSSITLNQAGDAIFGTVTSAGGPPVAVTGGSGLMRNLMELKQALELNDKTAIRAQLDQLESTMDSISTEQSRNGALMNRLELTRSRLESRSADLAQQYADIQDLDMPKLITDLNFQESVYQASLGVLSRVLQPSLLNSI